MAGKEIEARVAEVIDSSRIALNAGSDQGVTEGDEATLWRTITIKDPTTGDELGSARVSTLKVRVTFVKPRFCIASTVTQSTAFAVAFGRRPKISGASSRSSDEYVDVNVDDPATIYLTSPEDLL